MFVKIFKPDAAISSPSRPVKCAAVAMEALSNECFPPQTPKTFTCSALSNEFLCGLLQ